jgi:hypothetical protein
MAAYDRVTLTVQGVPIVSSPSKQHGHCTQRGGGHSVLRGHQPFRHRDVRSRDAPKHACRSTRPTATSGLWRSHYSTRVARFGGHALFTQHGATCHIWDRAKHAQQEWCRSHSVPSTLAQPQLMPSPLRSRPRKTGVKRIQSHSCNNSCHSCAAHGMSATLRTCTTLSVTLSSTNLAGKGYQHISGALLRTAQRPPLRSAVTVIVFLAALRPRHRHPVNSPVYRNCAANLKARLAQHQQAVCKSVLFGGCSSVGG